MSSEAKQTSFEYVGSELDLFAGATNWKEYWARELSPLIGERVLEVGAGIGSTPKFLCGPTQKRWLALEPDPALATRMRQEVESGRIPSICEVYTGDVSSLKTEEKFDSILYIDVLEHIEDDRGELRRSADFLSPGGRVIVLSPAHQWLFTPFDDALGHFRRYNHQTLKKATPENLRLEQIFYLDAVGLLASLGNKLVLRSSHPSVAQVKLWDDWMVPLSSKLDRWLGRRIGKSIVGVWSNT